MRNLKKCLILLLALSLVGGAYQGTSWAVQKLRTPVGMGPEHINDPLYGGYNFARVSNTSTVVVCTGHCLLAGLMLSTGANTTRLIIRNTGANDVTGFDGATAIGPIYFRVLDTGSERRSVVPLPMRFDSGGISVYIDSVASGEWATVLFLDLDE